MPVSEQTTTSKEEPVVIKRYASRKLYDAAAKEYVTLEDIARYIREGREIQIIDKKTGEDLTRQYLVQIIADFESQGEGETALPLNVLTDLVRHYQDQASAMTPAFLTDMFEQFREQQETMMAEFGSMRESMFDPQNAMDAVKDWQAKQAEFFGKAWQGWSGGDAPDKTQRAEEPSGVNHGESTESEKDRKIAELEAGMRAMQEQLNKLR